MSLPLYLNSGLDGNEASELAQKLYVVLNSRLPVRITTLSDRPDGSMVNPLKPNEEVVGTINTARGPLELVVERVNANGSRVWLFSRATLEAIPDVYSEIDLVTVDSYLPEIVARPRLFGIRVLDWLVLILGIPLGYRLLALSGPLLSPLVAAGRRRLGKADGPPLRIHPGPFDAAAVGRASGGPF